jgi:uncharacterized SAM-binding protein YcdF (DUF218 family)
MLRSLEKCLTPSCLCLFFLLIAAMCCKRPRLSKACLWSAIAILLLGGNEWIGRWAAIRLERQLTAPQPLPQADAIVVLGGAVRAKEWPRATVELGETGNRILHAFELFRTKKGAFILCAGGKAEPGIRETSEAEDMRALLGSFGVPSEAILVETNSLSTFENARNCQPMIEAKGVHRMLLVTSAVHMPRALAVFRRQFPQVEVIPAPTDYMFTDKPNIPPRELLEGFVPSADHLVRMEQTLHEYIGLLYYRWRGWI